MAYFLPLKSEVVTIKHLAELKAAQLLPRSLICR